MSPDSVSILLIDVHWWKMPKERFDELNVAEYDRYGTGSLMVWAALVPTEKLTCNLLKTEY